MNTDFGRMIIIFVGVLALAISPADGAVSLDGEQIIFSLSIPKGASVYLVGDFNNWNPTMDKMVWENDRYEIRLFLLPGKHKYMYVVNGETRADTDNPCEDKDGNSCFYFSEDNGKYRIRYFRKSGITNKKDLLETDLSSEVIAVYDKDDYSISVKGALEGSIEEDTRLRISSAILTDSRRTDSDAIGPVLLRSEALSDKGSWKMRAFYRMGELAFDDPLRLIGSVGPYNYPLGLFCRGIDAGVNIAEQFSGRVFYAGRTNGYSSYSTRERNDIVFNDQMQYAERDLSDSDIIAAILKGKVGGINLNYLFRHNKNYAKWYFSANESDCFLGGSELVNINGGWCSFNLRDSMLVELEYLHGSTRLSQLENFSESVGDCYMDDSRGESGWKMYAGIRRKFSNAELDLFYSYQRREGSSEDFAEIQGGAAQSLGFDADMTLGRFYLGVNGMAEFFSNLKANYFWFQSNNFWLDGDRVDSSSLLFLNSPGIYKARLDLSKAGYENKTYPNSRGTDISLLFMCESGDILNRVIEMKITHSIPLYPFLPFELADKNPILKNIDIFADLRGVSYNHRKWSGKNIFIDPFLALRKKFNESSWCMIGVGLNPYIFDKWYYNISYNGRERFLEDKGVFRELSPLNQNELIDGLGNAEEEMSSSWMISFETKLVF
ncbi:MAG: glycogen-binding domain-containing protein [Candidatus Krumholzibacteriota bacterium]|nr:glycogen-binding domain-containing protein [Candidatus Krumholzibacteriota bacterium]